MYKKTKKRGTLLPALALVILGSLIGLAQDIEPPTGFELFRGPDGTWTESELPIPSPIQCVSSAGAISISTDNSIELFVSGRDIAFNSNWFEWPSPRWLSDYHGPGLAPWQVFEMPPLPGQAALYLVPLSNREVVHVFRSGDEDGLLHVYTKDSLSAPWRIEALPALPEGRFARPLAAQYRGDTLQVFAVGRVPRDEAFDDALYELFKSPSTNGWQIIEMPLPETHIHDIALANIGENLHIYVVAGPWGITIDTPRYLFEYVKGSADVEEQSLLLPALPASPGHYAMSKPAIQFTSDSMHIYIIDWSEATGYTLVEYVKNLNSASWERIPLAFSPPFDPGALATPIVAEPTAEDANFFVLSRSGVHEYVKSGDGGNWEVSSHSFPTPPAQATWEVTGLLEETSLHIYALPGCPVIYT